MGNARLSYSKIIAAVFILLLAASAASAENRAGAVTFSPFYGKYMVDKHADYDDNTMYGAGIGYNFTQSIAAELSYGRVNTHRLDEDYTRQEGSLDIYRLEGLYHFFPECRFVPFLAAGAGLYSMSDVPLGEGRDNDFALDYGAGFKYFLIPDVALRADIRQYLNFKGNDEMYDSNWFYTAGLTFLFGGAKKAAEPVAVAEEAPAPAPVQAAAPRDSDGDGVIDSLDKCPGTPKGVKVDKDGCPKDSDGDGVPDYLDKCPDTPKGVMVDKDGCPKDSDGDGVPDYLDKCPNTPKGTKVDTLGCPVAEKAEITAAGTYSFGIIYFDTGKANIKPKSRPVLHDVIEYLNHNKEVKLEVQGHTDSVGPEAFNQKLSDARAASVKKYLTGKGIAADRLTTRGFGESKPAATNKTREGKAKNRRIEFMPIQ
jgi:OmpA-OmpF porin, OOP family